MIFYLKNKELPHFHFYRQLACTLAQKSDNIADFHLNYFLYNLNSIW
jgi:hypothetical protein